MKLIVQNALKLYSQDRTGLVDYALESGGKERTSNLISASVHPGPLNKPVVNPIMGRRD